MLRITAHKIAQLFPAEQTEQQTDYDRDEYEAGQYDKFNVYFIRETFIDPASR